MTDEDYPTSQSTVGKSVVDPEHFRLSSIVWCVLGITAGWTLWVILIVINPNVFGNDALRAVVRVSIVLFPSLIYVRRVTSTPIADYLLMRQNVWRGLITGLAAGIVIVVIVFVQSQPIKTLQFPTTFSSWFNFILGSPFAEEVLYRGVVLQYFGRRFGQVRGIVISALAFVLLHLPAWILLDRMSLSGVLSAGAQIFIYGVFFAVLFLRSKSFWTPFTAHFLNNLIITTL
jgi:membrane protease YdiL (CAAX protease family)